MVLGFNLWHTNVIIFVHISAMKVWGHNSASMIKYSWPAMTTALRNLFNFIGLLAISIYVSFIAVIREKETITFSFNLYCAHRATCSLLKLQTHLICLQRGTCFYRTMMSKPLRVFQVHVHTINPRGFLRSRWCIPYQWCGWISF